MHKQHFHFIGICGIGMSGIAKILRSQGYQVSGCDKQIDTQRTAELEKLGCNIGTHESIICKTASITNIVRSSDVTLNHPEIVYATQKNIPVNLRAEILANLMAQKISIAVAGAHGKTTTSALLSHVLLQAQLDPTIIVGGELHELKSNAHHGSGQFLVAEADESDRSFLLLPKTFSIVTNIDREHLNTYQDFDDIKNTFIKFMNQLPKHGYNIICLDDPGIQSIITSIKSSYLTYGLNPSSHFKITNISLFSNYSEFELYDTRFNLNLGLFKVSLPGMHNILNASAVIATCSQLGLNLKTIKNALESFQGVDRRFTLKGISKLHSAFIYDDYGHHPKEIQATLAVAENMPKNNLIMVFQPQRFSRTKHLWDDFIETFAKSKLKELIITDIYGANEAPIDGITSQNLVNEIKKTNPNIQTTFISFGSDGSEILTHLQTILNKNDLLLFQGAGKVNKLAQRLI